MINSVSNSLTGTNFAQRDYVVVDGKRYPVQKRPYNEPGVCTLAPVYRDVVVIDGKEYPVEEVSDMHACDKTKDVVVIDGKEYDVNAPFSLDALFPKGIIPQGIMANDNLQTQKINCVA